MKDEQNQLTIAEDIPITLRALRIIEELVKIGSPVTATDISIRTLMPAPSVHRLCRKLENKGFLTRDIEGRRYMPGPRVWNIASGLFHFANMYQARHAILRRLCERIGETCNIAIPDKGGMLYLDRVETEWPLRVHFSIGSLVPLHSTASGKLYLSSLSKSQRKKVVNALVLDKRAKNTIMSPDKLLREIDEIAERGYSLDNEEFVPGMLAVGVPIKNAKGEFIAALTFHAPKVRMPIDEAIKHVDTLNEMANLIEKIESEYFIGDDEEEES